MTNSKYNAHTDPLFKSLKLLKIKDIFDVQGMKICYKFVNNNVPTYFASMFRYNRELQDDSCMKCIAGSLTYLYMSTTLCCTPPRPGWPPCKRSAMTLVEVSQYTFLRFFIMSGPYLFNMLVFAMYSLCNISKCNFVLNKPVLSSKSWDRKSTSRVNRCNRRASLIAIVWNGIHNCFWKFD